MSVLDRLRDLLGRRAEPQLSTDAPGLAVVAEAFDLAEADSAVLARSHRWVAEKPAVLRHHLTLPPEQVEEAARILAQDGWELRVVSASARPVAVHALRVQPLDA